MKPTGINISAACLCRAKVKASRLDAKVTIKGEEMNHRIEIELPDGWRWNIRSVWEWWIIRPMLRRDKDV